VHVEVSLVLMPEGMQFTVVRVSLLSMVTLAGELVLSLTE